MKIGIITPAPPRSRHGNRVTALRWAGILRNLGHHVSISQAYDGRNYDLLVALHAHRSHPSIVRFRREQAQTPIVVALTGTDLYGDLQHNAEAMQSLEIATRVVVLQPLGIDEIPPALQSKVRVIHQSVAARSATASHVQEDQPEPPASVSGATVCSPISSASDSRSTFDVCVIGHLRPVKDPFRTASAARLLPASSRIRVLHVGGAMSDEMAIQARAEMAANPRYLWLGEQSRSRTRRILSESSLCVISSLLEGGANVLSEAIVASVPVVASRIPGTAGILGPDYPGYFTVGDTRELEQCLVRAETDPDYGVLLKSWGDGLASLFEPERERRAWATLLEEITVEGMN